MMIAYRAEDKAKTTKALCITGYALREDVIKEEDEEEEDKEKEEEEKEEEEKEEEVAEMVANHWWW